MTQHEVEQRKEQLRAQARSWEFKARRARTSQDAAFYKQRASQCRHHSDNLRVEA